MNANTDPNPCFLVVDDFESMRKLVIKNLKGAEPDWARIQRNCLQKSSREP